MARSFSNARLLSALAVDGFFGALGKRGYAAVSPGIASSVTKGGASISSKKMKKPAEEVAAARDNASWMADPVTGYYRPENAANEIDAAELREMLLKKKN